jgi:DNA-binding phage protein
METVKDFDPAEYIDNKEVAVEYLKAALAENDTKFLLRLSATLPVPRAWSSFPGN